LGEISNNLVALWDRYGIDDPQSLALELIELHSIAVDSAKTGQEVNIPPYLIPEKFPSFMKHKLGPNKEVYESKKVLGRLYQQVQSVIDKLDKEEIKVQEVDAGK
jgi:hypothetical protein